MYYEIKLPPCRIPTEILFFCVVKAAVDVNKNCHKGNTSVTIHKGLSGAYNMESHAKERGYWAVLKANVSMKKGNIFHFYLAVSDFSQEYLHMLLHSFQNEIGTKLAFKYA